MKQETVEELTPMNDLLQDLKRAKISSKDSIDIINDEFIRGTINKYVQTTLDNVIKRIETELLDKESKWYQEQDKKKYSEEDMREAIVKSALSNIDNMIERCDEIIEQFKNK